MSYKAKFQRRHKIESARESNKQPIIHFSNSCHMQNSHSFFYGGARNRAEFRSDSLPRLAGRRRCRTVPKSAPDFSARETNSASNMEISDVRRKNRKTLAMISTQITNKLPTLIPTFRIPTFRITRYGFIRNWGYRV